MSNNDVTAIQESRNYFNLDTKEVDEQGDSILDATIKAMSGYDDRPSTLLVEGANGSMDLQKALNFVQFRESTAWASIVDAWQTLAADLEKKVDNDKLSDSERMSAVNQRKGLLQGLAVVASMLKEATERVGSIDAQDKSTLGLDAKKVVAKAKTLPTEVVSSKPSEAKPQTTVSKEVTDNTAAALAFFSKKGSN